jgi:hypothetical protein
MIIFQTPANILPIIFKLLLSNPVWFCVKFYHSNRLVKAPAQYPHDAAFPRNQLANIFAVSFEILKSAFSTPLLPQGYKAKL